MSKSKQSVLVGVSRGASTSVNFMGMYNPTQVAALVLESPFDCVESIITHLLHNSKCSWIPGFKKHGLRMMQFIFCKYKPNGIRPIDSVSQIKADLPILLICSPEDTLVPIWSSINLYHALKESGHENTYLLILPEGKHAQLINNKKSGTLYQCVTHAFYKKFGLPYCPYQAKQGELLLENCQPDRHSLQFLYPSYVISKAPSTKNTNHFLIGTSHEKRLQNHHAGTQRRRRKVCG
jgi:hypothetical protein